MQCLLRRPRYPWSNLESDSVDVGCDSNLHILGVYWVIPMLVIPKIHWLKITHSQTPAFPKLSLCLHDFLLYHLCHSTNNSWTLAYANSYSSFKPNSSIKLPGKGSVFSDNLMRCSIAQQGCWVYFYSSISIAIFQWSVYLSISSTMPWYRADVLNQCLIKK
jgi:hypothetical protein